jgi:hypothetical protein
MKRFLLVAAFVACALFVAGPASAFTLGLNDLIGTVDPATPSNIDAEVLFSNTLITAYNTSTSPPDVVIGPTTNDLTLAVGVNVPAPPLDLVSATGALTVDPPVIPYALGTSYDYVYAKFGGYGALYWLGGQTGNFEGFTGATSGLSHFVFFNPTQVPEGATLMMLGFGLAGVGTLRRFVKL